ncbi:MAG: hypothetical protein IPP08_00755 [Chlorobiota bacterium]|nr:MAG: hypothetical protein IPP08_00755 [Chlorobiota bacterium]
MGNTIKTFPYNQQKKFHDGYETFRLDSHPCEGEVNLPPLNPFQVVPVPCYPTTNCQVETKRDTIWVNQNPPGPASSPPDSNDCRVFVDYELRICGTNVFIDIKRIIICNECLYLGDTLANDTNLFYKYMKLRDFLFFRIAINWYYSQNSGADIKVINNVQKVCMMIGIYKTLPIYNPDPKVNPNNPPVVVSQPSWTIDYKPCGLACCIKYIEYPFNTNSYRNLPVADSTAQINCSGTNPLVFPIGAKVLPCRDWCENAELLNIENDIKKFSNVVNTNKSVKIIKNKIIDNKKSVNVNNH